jgi:hypothetical protein
MSRTFCFLWLVFLTVLLFLDSWVWADTRHTIALVAVIMESMAIGLILLVMVGQRKK